MAVNNYIKWPAERIRQDENNRFVTDVQVAKWDGITIPEAIKNPNALSIQLNGGTAKTYDGSSALSIDITPASIGAATNNHTHDYIPLSGTEALTGDIIPDSSATSHHNNDGLCIGFINNPFGYVYTKYIDLVYQNGAVSYGSFSIGLDSNGSGGHVLFLGTDSIGVIDIISRSSSNTINIGTSSFRFGDAYLKNIDATQLTMADDTSRMSSILNHESLKFGNENIRTTLTVKPKWGENTINGNHLNIYLQQKEGTLALLEDIPKSLPASDVKDWAKADTKPTYTFAEITEKPEKFTPDTHTHSISEITDLQTTLDNKAAKNHTHDSEKVTNWNNVIVSGTYYAAADATNNPSADAAYSGNVIKGSTIVTQSVVKETIDGDLYKYIRRGQLDTDRTTVTTWGQWQEIQYVVTE